MKDNEIINAVIIAAAVVVLLGAFSGFGMMPGFSYGMMSGFSGMFLFGWIFMALILIALILGIIWLFQQIQKNERRSG